MDQIKIGAFLKKLRKEKNLTQENLAERLNISSRTVSRWETGSNMPDISLLIEIAEFYDVSIPELIDGERKSEKMNEEVKESSLKLAEYAQVEKTTLMKKLTVINVVGLFSLLLAFTIEETTHLLSFVKGACSGMAVGALLVSVLFSTGVLSKISNSEKARNAAKAVKIICLIIVLISLISVIYFSFR